MNQTICKVTLSIGLLASLITWNCCHVEAGKFPLKMGKIFGLNKLFRSDEPEQYVKEYELIDVHLTKHLPDDETVTANMEVAQQWLNQLTESKIWQKKKLIKGLKRFLSLRKMDGDKLCIKSSGETLEINDRSTNESVGRLLSGSGVEARRIEKIIFHYAKRHLDECPDKLKERYKLINPKVNKELKQQIIEFMETIIAHHMIYDEFREPGFDPKGDINSYIDHNPLVAALFVGSSMKPIGTEKDLMIMFSYLDSITETKNDIRRMALHNDDEDGHCYYRSIMDLFDQYLVRPCDDYHNWYDSIYDPIEFDFKYLDETEIMSKSNPIELDMMQNLALYEGCESLLKNKKLIRKRFVDFMEWVIHVRGFELM